MPKAPTPTPKPKKPTGKRPNAAPKPGVRWKDAELLPLIESEIECDVERTKHSANDDDEEKFERVAEIFNSKMGYLEGAGRTGESCAKKMRVVNKIFNFISNRGSGSEEWYACSEEEQRGNYPPGAKKKVFLTREMFERIKGRYPERGDLAPCFVLASLAPGKEMMACKGDDSFHLSRREFEEYNKRKAVRGGPTDVQILRELTGR